MHERGLGGATVNMAKEQVWSLVSKELKSTMEVTFGSHSTSETGRSLDSYGFGKMGLALSAPTHKVAFLEKPISQEMDGPGPLRKKAFLGPKVGPSTALLDLDPFFLKNHQPMLHVQDLCLETEIDKYEKTSPSSTPSVFGQTPTMEEFVCHGGVCLA